MNLLRADQLAHGDTIRFAADGDDFTLTAPPVPYAGQEGLLRLTLDGDFAAADGLAFPAPATVIAVHAPRAVQARCLLCPAVFDSGLEIDLADPDHGTNPRSICPACSARVAARIIGE